MNLRKIIICVLAAAALCLSAVADTTVSGDGVRAEDIMNVKVLQSFEGYEVGTKLVTTDPNQPVTGSNWEDKIVPVYAFNVAPVTVDARAGFEDSPSLEIYSQSEQRHDSGARPMIKVVKNNRDFTADDYILFYIRLTNASNQLFPSVRFCNGLTYDGELWCNLGDRKAEILPFGTDNWQEITAQGGILYVDSGFSGFVRFRIGELRSNDGETPAYGVHRIDSIAVDPDKFGGVYGAFYLDAFYLASSAANTASVTDGSRSGSLFDYRAGSDDKVYDFFPGLPVEAGIVTGFPETTIEAAPSELEPLSRSVSFVLPQNSAVSSYKVGIFRNVFAQTGEGRYLLEAYRECGPGRVEIEGLWPESEYTIVALGFSGSATEGYLQRVTFHTSADPQGTENEFAQDAGNSCGGSCAGAALLPLGLLAAFSAAKRR